MGTVLIESDDFSFRLQYIVGVILNTIIIIQFFLYWSNSGKAPAGAAGGKKVAQAKAVKERKGKLE